ncbi:uncharacterized protein LOC121868578 isoform X2 [Homarus americanus]|uniref:uncharacterized protein LOC121868578 isoform X2 n=1 Tax=Homarus americanus TaxID=6706 RepID=UPI001C4895F2|nr:uncharacterized protein LOC121868578 isoform X2 [Homarus americanus]
MRCVQLLLASESSRIHSLVGITSSTSGWFSVTNRRVCGLTTSTPRTVYRTSHLQVPVRHSPFDTSWLQQRRSLCSVTFTNTSTAEAVTPEQEVVLRYVQPTSQVTMLMNYFNISRNTVYRILKKEPRLKACDVYTLARNMTTFMENCLCPEEVKEFISLLYRCPLTMEHNIAILKELGLHNLTAYYYIQFNKLFKCKVSLMKSWRLLPEKYDPRESVLAAMGVPQELLLTVNLPQDINECTLSEVHRELSIVFLRWCLKCDQDNIGKLRRTYNLTKSMKLQQQVVHQLHHQWDIGTSKVSLSMSLGLYKMVSC